MEAAAAVTNDFSNVTMSNDAATDVGGLAITGSANDDTVTATAGNDSFDVMPTLITPNDGCAGDSITMGTGEVTVIVASGDSGTTFATADTLAGFTSGTDTITSGTAGTFANYSEVDLAATAGSGMADAVAGATFLGVMDGTIQFVLVENQSANAANADGLDLQTDSVLCMTGI